MEHFIPYRYNTYSDVLVALGTAQLACYVYDVEASNVFLTAEPGGFRVRHGGQTDDEGQREDNPFFQIRDKPSRDTDETLGAVLDKTDVGDERPAWWSTVSTINSLATPDFNNKIAQAYTPELGAALLDGTAEIKTGSMSQLLYAQASKGVNSTGLSTSQSNVKADAEQASALLGYQTVGTGFIRGDYTLSIVPRPESIRLDALVRLTTDFLRGYLPRTAGGKILPTQNQTVPFFLAMMYFDFIIELFNYREREPEAFANPFEAETYTGIGKVVSSLDRAMYFSMGTSSAPFVLDAFAIPEWLGEKAVAMDVRDLVREMLSARVDPNVLYLPVRAFAESDPRALVDFYRIYDPLKPPSGTRRKGKRLLRPSTLTYILDMTGYDDLNCGAMQRFARAIRSRTLTKLYRSNSEPPDYGLLTKLKSAATNDRRLVSMLSAFIGSYNLRNARLSSKDKDAEGKNLSYEDLQVVIRLIDTHGAEFVANTLMAQAMSKREEENSEDAVSAPSA